MNTKHFIIGLASATLLAAASSIFQAGHRETTPTQALVGHGDVATLKTAVEDWRKIYELQGGSPEILKLSLGYAKALSSSFTRGRGKMEFNLLDGNLVLQLSGLEDGAYDLWFVDDADAPGNTVKPDPDDRLLRLGGMEVKGGKGSLAVQLTREQLAGISLDSAVVTPAGKSPLESVVLFGGPDLLQKLYYARQPWAMGEIAGVKDLSTASREPVFAFLLPKVAMADTVSDLTQVLGAQVALGRQIFHHETFNGNGRTCGTCHRDENNFTLDPNFIATLPPTDPLFLAETKPNLAGLENPTLMRKYGLVLTNVDGPGFDVFRSVPHLFSLPTTIVSENTNPVPPYTKGDFEADNNFANALGWSGDGAPGSGSLREFTLGAIAQHLPKSLNRKAGTDFRLPTNDELDAIVAYELSLGRSKDYPVWKLSFKDPLTQAGKVLFDTKQNPCTHNTSQTVNVGSADHPQLACPSGETVVLGATANCNGCHQHAGGRSSTTFANPTRDTGIENLAVNPARLVKPDLNYDGGLGLIALNNCGPSGSSTCYGDLGGNKRFNTPPLIEAADTSPYYHNHVVSTLEEAIAAYNSDAFNHSPGALTSKLANRQIKLDSTQVVAIASFMRAINALENIRLSNRLDNQARQVANNASARELAKLAQEENQDAIRVLQEGVMGAFSTAVGKLQQAAYYENLAQLAPAQAMRSSLLQSAIARKREAWSLIASCNDSAQLPPSVGASPAGFVYTCAELTAF